MAGKRIRCTDKEIIEASETTMSAFEASRKLGINYKTYRTYAIRLNCFKTNQSGKGMDKNQYINQDMSLMNIILMILIATKRLIF